MHRLRQVSLASFAGIIICFVFSFVTISCEGEEVSSLTGIQLLTGGTIQGPSVYGQSESRQYPPNGAARLAFLAAVVGLVLSGLRSRAPLEIAPAAAVIVALLILKSGYDAEVQQQGMGILRVQYGAAFWLAIMLGTVAGFAGLFRLNDKRASPPIDEPKPTPSDKPQQVISDVNEQRPGIEPTVQKLAPDYRRVLVSGSFAIVAVVIGVIIFRFVQGSIASGNVSTPTDHLSKSSENEAAKPAVSFANELETGPRSSVSLQRCADHATARPLPKATLMDRIKRKSLSVAKTLPNAVIWLEPPTEAAGSIAYLRSGEICVGSTLLMSVADFPQVAGTGMFANFPSKQSDFSVALSSPNRDGFRLLALVETRFGKDTPLNTETAWIVHPDSLLPLSIDLLSGHRDTGHPPRETLVFDSVPGRTYWSPDGKHLALLLSQHFAGDETSGGPVVLVASIPEPAPKYVSLKKLRTPWDEVCSNGSINRVDFRFDNMATKWLGAELLQVRLYLASHENQCNGQYNAPSAPPFDTVSIITVDLARGAASRVQ